MACGLSHNYSNAEDNTGKARSIRTMRDAMNSATLRWVARSAVNMDQKILTTAINSTAVNPSIVGG